MAGVVAIDPCQKAVPELFAAGQQAGQLSPSLPDQPGADMAAQCVMWRFFSCLLRQADDLFGDLFLGSGAGLGEVLDRPPAAVTGGEIHAGIDPGRIETQYLLYPAQLFKDLPPVQQAKLAQAGKGIAAGHLLPGLPVLFTQVEVEQRGFEGALEPALDRRQGGGLVEEQADQLRTEIRAGLRFRLGKFRQDGEELVGIAAIGGGQPVCPEVGQLPFAQVRQGGDGQTLDAFDKRDAQHLGDCPEFAAGEGAHGLVGLDIGQDILPVETQFGMGNKFLGQAVDARQPPVEIRGQDGQLLVIAAGKV